MTCILRMYNILLSPKQARGYCGTTCVGWFSMTGYWYRECRLVPFYRYNTIQHRLLTLALPMSTKCVGSLPSFCGKCAPSMKTSLSVTSRTFWACSKRAPFHRPFQKKKCYYSSTLAYLHITQSKYYARTAVAWSRLPSTTADTFRSPIQVPRIVPDTVPRTVPQDHDSFVSGIDRSETQTVLVATRMFLDGTKERAYCEYFAYIKKKIGSSYYDIHTCKTLFLKKRFI